MKNIKKDEYLNKFDIEDNIYNFNNKLISCLDFKNLDLKKINKYVIKHFDFDEKTYIYELINDNDNKQILALFIILLNYIPKEKIYNVELLLKDQYDLIDLLISNTNNYEYLYRN